MVIRAFLALATIMAVVFGGAGTAAAGSGNNYPEPWRSGSLGAYVDSWGYSSRYCTSWVAWALRDRNGFEMPRAIGNASNWGPWASSHGYTVNMTPAKGSVAWWSSNHVAWVEAVNGDQVTIEEYNYGFTGNYNRRVINRTSVSGYIHFMDIPSTPSTTKIVNTDFNRDGKSDLYAINRNDSGSNSTSVHIVNGNGFNSWLLQTGTVLGPTTTAWNFR